MAGKSSKEKKGRLLADSSLAGPFGPSTCAVAHYIHYRRTPVECQPFQAEISVFRQHMAFESDFEREAKRIEGRRKEEE
jgi:hypothetical protein